MTILFGALAVLAIVLVGCSIVGGRRLIGTLGGFVVSALTALSAYFLHSDLLRDGFEGGLLGPWGFDRPVVLVAYAAGLLGGIAMAVYALIKCGRSPKA